MSRITVYVCDNCGVKAEIDRSYWKEISVENSNRRDVMFCPECVKKLLTVFPCLGKPRD